jgi:hypothetical protein
LVDDSSAPLTYFLYFLAGQQACNTICRQVIRSLKPSEILLSKATKVTTNNITFIEIKVISEKVLKLRDLPCCGYIASTAF